MTEKFTILKLRLGADKILILAGFILFTFIFTVGFSVLPIKISADNNSLNIYKTAKNITKQESNWQKSITANPGDKIAFSIRINTSLSSNIYNVNISDSLPSQFSYASGSTRIDGNSASDGIVSGGINIGTLYGGQSKTITFEAYVSSSSQYFGSTLTNYGYVRADNVSQQSDSAQVFIGSGASGTASLNIYKTVRNISRNENSWQKTTSANSGDRLAFQLQISTNNNTTANNAVATDSLPSQISYAIGSTRIDGNYSASDNIVSNGLFIGIISSGQTKIITFEATVVSGYSYSSNNTLTNYAYAKADNVSQQSDSAQIFINSNYQTYGQTYLTLRKTVQNTNNPNGNETDNAAMPGDTLRYTFYYTNSGNYAIYNLRIVDDLPSYLSVISADNGGIYDERTNQTTWNIGTMSADGLRSGSVSYIAKIINPPSSAIIRNTGIIRADNFPDATSNEVRTTISAIAAVAYQTMAPAQVIRAVTGANNILTNSAAAAAVGGLAVFALYLITKNLSWFTNKKLRLKILTNKLSR